MARTKKPYKTKTYKSGKRNRNAYRDRFVTKIKIFLTVVLIFSVICGMIEILDRTRILTWGDILGDNKAVETIKKTDADFTVYYLDSGQSDAALITCGDKTMLIDAATANRVDVVASAMKRLHRDTIDYMVISHQHHDHLGSAEQLLKDYDVKNVIMPRLTEINMVTTVEYESFLKTLSEKETKTTAAEPGLTFDLNGAKVEILAPLKQDKELNNMSAVLKITYGETSFLFQGDAEKKVENALLKENIDLSADVIKLGHHGSKTSSSDKYLKAVSPEIAVISCAYDNDYGHPHKETVDTLEKNNIDYYITFIDGSITVTSDGKTLKVATSETNKVKTYE